MSEVRRRGLPRVRGGQPWPPQDDARAAVAVLHAPAAAVSPAPAAPAATAVDRARFRRGLPRRAGDEAWPPLPEIRVEPALSAAPAVSVAPTAGVAPSAADTLTAGLPAAPRPAVLTLQRTAWAGTAPRHDVGDLAAREVDWSRRITLAAGAITALLVAICIVFLTRWGLSTSAGAEFLDRFPGHGEVPDGTPAGFPPWLRWQHFLNA